MTVSFGGLISDKRRTQGQTQDSFARKVGISRNYLSLLESNKAGSLSADVLARLALAAQIDFHELVDAYLVQYYPHEARLLEETAPQKGT